MEFLVAVLSARPDSVSNFVKVDSVFGPVMADTVVTRKLVLKGQRTMLMPAMNEKIMKIGQMPFVSLASDMQIGILGICM